MITQNIAIVQARMGSARFPGKMLAHLGGVPLIEWVLRRLSLAKTLSQIILATTNDEVDDVLVEIATSLGCSVFRGSGEDVLSRFMGAVSLVGATNIVRVCADNPFIDPEEVDRLTIFFSQNQCDYACNHQDRLGSGYADGFGAEIFSATNLKKISELAKEPRHREHATLYFWDNAGEFNLRSVKAPVNLAFPKLRFDVDTPQDLEYLSLLVNTGLSLYTPASQIIRIASTLVAK